MSRRVTLTIEDMALLAQMINAAYDEARTGSHGNPSKHAAMQRLNELKVKVTEEVVENV